MKDINMSWSSSFMRFSGQVKLPLLGDAQFAQEKVLNQLEQQLRLEWARKIERRGDFVIFTGNFFRFFKWHAGFLTVIDAGFLRVTINERNLIVDYRLSFLWIFWYCFFMSFIWLAITNGVSENIMPVLILNGIYWALVFWANIFWPLISMRLFIRRVYSDLYEKSWTWKILYWFS